jgi:hypothetical protein
MHSLPLFPYRGIHDPGVLRESGALVAVGPLYGYSDAYEPHFRVGRWTFEREKVDSRSSAARKGLRGPRLFLEDPLEEFFEQDRYHDGSPYGDFDRPWGCRQKDGKT